MGRARPGRDLDGDARDARRGAVEARRRRAVGRRDRHHEPARDRRRVGPRARAGRCTAPSSGRTGARPARCDELRDAGQRAARAGADRARPRPLLLGDQAGVAAHARAASTPGPTSRSAPSTRWILWRLTGGPDGGVHATDPSNACRTLLYDIDALGWSDELLRAVRRPALVPSRGPPEQRPVRRDRRPSTPPGSRVPVSGIAGDQQAALFGQACFETGMTKNTYGTGSFVLDEPRSRAPAADRGPPDQRRRGTSAATSTYVMEGAIFVTGAAIQWLRDGLGIIDDAAETGPLAAERRRHRRRRVRPRVHRARLAVVGPVRARHGARAHPRLGSRAGRAGGRRVDGVADRATSSTRSRLRRARRSASCASTAAPA